MNKNKSQEDKIQNQNDPNTELKYIAINTKKSIKILKVSDIIYLKAFGNLTIIYLQNQTSVTAFKNLGYYEKIFKEGYFLKVHRSYTLNVAYLENIFTDSGGHYCVLRENHIIPISNRKFPIVKKFLYL